MIQGGRFETTEKVEFLKRSLSKLSLKLTSSNDLQGKNVKKIEIYISFKADTILAIRFKYGNSLIKKDTPKV